MVVSQKQALAFALVGVAALPSAAHAQDVNLNYDRLSSLEEPIAYDFEGITIALTGVADVPVIAEFNDVTGGDDVRVEAVGNFQVTAETQLGNRWTIGAAYFGQYASSPLDGFGGSDDYSDNVAGFIGTSFGTVIGGNVNQQVRELTRRQRGVGNGFLAFDDFLGSLDNWGGAYVGRFGPSVLGLVIDENGDFEAGTVFQRPIGVRDLRFSARYRRAQFTAADGVTTFDTNGAGLVGEFVYGSSLFDVGGGYEHLDGALTDLDRWFVSAGAQTQLGPLRVSAEGHFGEADGDEEIAVALGADYAVARGLSVNLGLNHADATIVSDGVTLVQTDEVKAVGSVRFSF
ncbi:MAG: hypothetical protein ABJN35_08750 [Erythrobacter sp.]